MVFGTATPTRTRRPARRRPRPPSGCGHPNPPTPRSSPATSRRRAGRGTPSTPARDGDSPNRHPSARRTYVLRSRIRYRACHRRMCGVTRPPAGTTTACRPCPACTTSARTTRATPATPPPSLTTPAHLRPRRPPPGRHPPVLRRADLRPRTRPPPRRADPRHRRRGRRPAGEEDRRAAQRRRQIDAAENAHAREMRTSPTWATRTPPPSRARTRIISRFTELEEERAQIGGELDALTREDTAAPDPDLLDTLPRLGDILTDAPARLQQQLYDAFDLQLLYNKEDHQVSIHAAITASHPRNPRRYRGRHHARHRHHHPRARQHPATCFGFSAYPYVAPIDRDHGGACARIGQITRHSARSRREMCRWP